ncbi:hypothetical protein D3C78_1977150 [compost metagenome]
MFELVEALTSCHKRSCGVGTIVELSETLEEVQLLESIPGVGTKLATAIVSEIGDAYSSVIPSNSWHMRD